MDFSTYLAQKAANDRAAMLALSQQKASPRDVILRQAAIPDEVPAGNTMTVGSNGQIGLKDQPTQQPAQQPSQTGSDTGTQIGNTVGNVGGAYAAEKGIEALGASEASGAGTAGAEAAGAETAGAEAGGASMGGAASTAGMAALAAIMAQNTYESGGRQILKGDATEKDWINTALNSNTMTAWANPMTKALGMGTVGRAIVGGKNESEQMQEVVRGRADEVGLFSRPNGASQGMMSLADGTMYNIESKGKQSHIIDPTLKNGQQAILWSDSLAFVVTGQGGEAQAALTGYLVNGATSNATSIEGIRANILQQVANLGLDKDSWIKLLTGYKDAGKIDQSAYDVYVSSVNSLFSGDAKSYTTITPAEAAEIVRQAQSGGASSSTPSGSGTFTSTQTPNLPAGAGDIPLTKPTQIQGGSSVLDAIKQAMARQGAST